MILLVMTLLAILNAAPLTFFAMLFFGNLGLHLSFMALLPGAMAVSCLKTNYPHYKRMEN